jgi:hypothetical protein
VARAAVIGSLFTVIKHKVIYESAMNEQVCVRVQFLVLSCCFEVIDDDGD